VRPAAALALAAALLAASVGQAADPPSATATLTPAELSSGQIAILQIEVTGAFRLAAAPTLPLTNLTVVSGPSLENRFEWINGRSSSRTELVYRVRAGEPGRAAVGAIRLVAADGRVVATEPISASIGKGTPEAPLEATGDPALVARLEPPSPYVGQQAVWTLYLVTRGQATRGEVQALPDFRGFWAEDLEREPNVQPQVWNLRGTLVRAYPMIRKALFATRPGKLSIGPARARVAVRVDSFDLFDSPFADAPPVERASAAIPVIARPAPAPGVPVGTFAFRSSIDRPRVAAGGSLAFTAQLSGDGRLADVPAPPLAVEGARVSEPESRLSIRRSASRLSSTRTWQWVVTPERGGELALPALSIRAFDPALGRVVTVSTGALRASVESAAPAPVPAPRAPRAAPASRGISPEAAAAAAAAAAALLLVGFWVGRRRTVAAAAPAPGSPAAEIDVDRLLDALDAAAARRGTEAREQVSAWRRRRDEIRFAPHFSSREESAARLEAEIRRAAARELG